MRKKMDEEKQNCVYFHGILSDCYHRLLMRQQGCGKGSQGHLF